MRGFRTMKNINKMKGKIEFEGIFKKGDLFSETLHLIIYPRGSIINLGKIYDIKEGKKVKITISQLND